MDCNTNPLLSIVATLFKLIFEGNPFDVIIRALAGIVLQAAIVLLDYIIGYVPTFGGEAAAVDVADQSKGVVAYLAIGSLLVATIRMALERRGEAGVTAMKGLLRLI